MHANYATALQVEKIIRYLKDTCGAKLLFTEGASEKLHPELLNFFPDRKRIKNF
jgi:hypothetical protein